MDIIDFASVKHNSHNNSLWWFWSQHVISYNLYCFTNEVAAWLSKEIVINLCFKTMAVLEPFLLIFHKVYLWSQHLRPFYSCKFKKRVNKVTIDILALWTIVPIDLFGCSEFFEMFQNTRVKFILLLFSERFILNYFHLVKVTSLQREKSIETALNCPMTFCFVNFGDF